MPDVNKIKVTISVTPVVEKAAGSDADAIEVLHHDVGQSLGTSYEISADSSNLINSDTARFFYKDIQVTTTSANIAGGFLDLSGGATSSYTDGTSISASDLIRFLYVENLGFDGDGNALEKNHTNALCLSLDGGGYSNDDSIMIAPGESIAMPLSDNTVNEAGPTIGEVHLDHPSGSPAVIRTRVLFLAADVST